MLVIVLVNLYSVGFDSFYSDTSSSFQSFTHLEVESLHTIPVLTDNYFSDSPGSEGSVHPGSECLCWGGGARDSPGVQ